MKKVFKSLIKITMTLVILFIIVSVAFTALVDINHYKSNIIRLVEQEAGLNLEINGEMNLTIFSGLKFNAKNIKISHGEELIAEINSLHLGVDLYSIYAGEPEIHSVKLNVKTLNIFRDKNSQFNFLPLYHGESNKDRIHNKNGRPISSTSDKFSLNSLAIKDISLSIDKFHYLDDLESVSVKLNKTKAILSLLPIIDHHELVIDDPRVLVGFTYSGELEVKQALINQYQISNLALEFVDKKGNFVADKLSFSLIQEGVNHATPPLVFDVNGKLVLSLAYDIPEGASEPLWLKPDVIKLGSIDLNIPTFKLTDKELQFESDKAHLTFDEVAIFEAHKYTLDNLLFKSLSFDAKKLSVKVDNEDHYLFTQFVLQISNFLIIEKGKPVDVLSENFLRIFSQKGNIKLSSDSLSTQKLLSGVNGVDGFEKIDLNIEGKNNKINLKNFSFNAADSKMKGNGFLLFNKAGHKEGNKWQFKMGSEKLNLSPFSKFLDTTGEITGYVSVDINLSGDYKNSELNIQNGIVKTKGENLAVSGVNLDNILNDFQNSQSVGLLDIGAVALLGPAGLVVNKSNDYRVLLDSVGNKGVSQVKQLNSEISYANDIANMDDVAFSTDKFRVVVKGKVNLDTQAFINFKVATIDKNGCPVYEESVKGSLESPSVKKVNVLVSGVVNPVNSLISKIKKPLNVKCDNPYAGVVEAPVK